jgi:hypothetical protein
MSKWFVASFSCHWCLCSVISWSAVMILFSSVLHINFLMNQQVGKSMRYFIGKHSWLKSCFSQIRACVWYSQEGLTSAALMSKLKVLGTMEWVYFLQTSYASWPQGVLHSMQDKDTSLCEHVTTMGGEGTPALMDNWDRVSPGSTGCAGTQGPPALVPQMLRLQTSATTSSF